MVDPKLNTINKEKLDTAQGFSSSREQSRSVLAPNDAMIKPLFTVAKGSIKSGNVQGASAENRNSHNFGKTAEFKRTNPTSRMHSKQQRRKDLKLNQSAANFVNDIANESNRNPGSFYNTGSTFNPGGVPKTYPLKIPQAEVSLKVVQTLIEKCHEVMRSHQVFIRNNLNSNRVLKDVMDYLRT